MGVSQGRPVGRSNGQGGQGGTQGPNSTGVASQPSPQSPTAMPWDAQATGLSAQGQRSYGDEMASIGSERDFTLRNIGLGAGYENNPYSQASLLQRQREIGMRGTLNRAGNQLYAGSTVNRLGGVDRSYGEGRYNLEQLKAAKEAQWDQRSERALHAKEGADEEAQWGAIERASDAPPAPAPLGGGKGWTGQAPTGKKAGTIKPWKGSGKKGGKGK